MRDYKHKRREPLLPRGTLILILVIVGIMLAGTGCAASSHNARGGYVDACGQLPGMIGDDC